MGHLNVHYVIRSSVAAGFGRHGMPPPTSNPELWPFDRETGVRVASKVGNLPSKFGYARPLGSRIIRYVHDGRTDRGTDGQKQRLLPPSLRWGHNNNRDNYHTLQIRRWRCRIYSVASQACTSVWLETVSVWLMPRRTLLWLTHKLLAATPRDRHTYYNRLNVSSMFLHSHRVYFHLEQISQVMPDNAKSYS